MQLTTLNSDVMPYNEVEVWGEKAGQKPDWDKIDKQ